METIQFSVQNGVARIILNRPDQMNAINETMISELKEVFKQIEKDDTVRAVMLTGNGRGFCAGQDLKEIDEHTDISEVVKKRYNPLIEKIADLEKPVIAAVNGTAAGAGMSLALASDFRLVHEQAKFVEAFIHIGLVLDSGSTYFLPRFVGHAKAMELAILGESVTAEQAKALNLATKVIPSESWNQEVTEFSERLANMPTKAIGLMKRYLRKSWDSDLSQVLENEAYAQHAAQQSEDHHEGIQAFLEKRKPVFKGK